MTRQPWRLTRAAGLQGGSMRSPVSAFSAIAFSLFLSACQGPDLPGDLIATSEASSFSMIQGAPLDIPMWIASPSELPEDLRGRNNCTFAFGQSAAQWDFHPEGACWERPGPDGWTRNQQYRVHVPALAECGGGAGDVSPIRICRAPGELNPCHINPTTGPRGCALCVLSLACH